MAQNNSELDYDYIVIGSGFGGSVSALRLAEKGYSVLVLEKGRWLRAKDFPRTNWNLRKWLWMPALRFFGLFKITVFRHVTIFSGVGVGGGSLVYANTLPVPKKPFYQAPSWSHLADWERELSPFYKLSQFMLGATPNPRMFAADETMRSAAIAMGKESDFKATNVAVYFGQPGKTVKDPYFGGKGPDRTGCIFCGGCMLGCRHDSKNTLDKNYLYFAQLRGAKIQAESLVTDVRPLGAADGSDGYVVHWKPLGKGGKGGQITAKGVVFSGGVLGTVELLLGLRRKI